MNVVWRTAVFPGGAGSPYGDAIANQSREQFSPMTCTNFLPKMPVKWFIKTPEKSQWSPLPNSYTKICTTLTGSRLIKNNVCKSNYQEPVKRLDESKDSIADGSKVVWKKNVENYNERGGETSASNTWMISRCLQSEIIRNWTNANSSSVLLELA